MRGERTTDQRARGSSFSWFITHDECWCLWLSRASAAEVARKEWQIAFFVVSIGGSTFSMVPAGRVLCGWYRCNGGSEKNQEINSKFALHLLHWMQKGICFLLHNVGCWGRESRRRRPPLLHRLEWLRWTRLRFSPILCTWTLTGLFAYSPYITASGFRSEFLSLW